MSAAYDWRVRLTIDGSATFRMTLPFRSSTAPPPPSPEPHPYPSLAIVGSRRLLGANLYSTRPGAVLELSLQPDEAKARLTSWAAALRIILTGIGWEAEEYVVRYNDGASHASVFLTAPLDGLLAATEVNEQAWLAMEQAFVGGTPDYADIAARLRVFIQHDRHPVLVALVQAAHARSLAVMWDDESFTIGSGSGSRTWPASSLPAISSVPWPALHDIPLVLVTGSNGKTTTTRLIARLLRAAGHVVGWCCTDGVWVGEDLVADGDYSGPAGARIVLQDQRVTAAVLETARGGILRRGLAVERALVAVVTGIADDHLGEYGIDSLHALGETKLVVAKVVPTDGCVVLNADDPTLRSLASTLSAPLVWYSASGHRDTTSQLIADGANACVLDHESLIAIRHGQRHPLVAAPDMPLSLGGRMRYNIANALAASAAALALGVSLDQVRTTLRTFGASVADNPGRLATLSLRGARLLVDFVHNPDGWDAVTRGLAGVAGRRLVVVGQAGDRDDRALHELAAAVWRFSPDFIVLKEMTSYLRGRAFGETTDLLAREFAALGAVPERMLRAESELAALDCIADHARPGDVIVVGVHDDFEAALTRLQHHGAVVGSWS